MDAAEMLMQFALTRQEALIYMALTTDGAMTGYEVAKQLGISRSNCYTSLASLVEKGAAYLLEDTATRYVAVKPEEFCGNRIRMLEELKDKLAQQLLPRAAQTEGYLTIGGQENMIDKAVFMIEHGAERLYLSAERVCLEPLIPSLTAAAERGMQVTVITEVPFSQPGIRFYTADCHPGQIRLIVDSNAVLTGDLTTDGTCLYSRKKNLIDLFKEAMRNEIQLIELYQNEKGSVL